MKKVLMLLFMIYFVIGLVGCNKEKTEFDGIRIENAYIIKNDIGIPLKNNSVVYFDNNTRIHYNVNWNYIIKHITEFDNIPKVETLYPEQYMHYIYLNNEIIETNMDSYSKSEYREIEYAITHNLLDSNIEFSVSTSDHFLIAEEGDYKIECFFIIKVNGEEIESYDSFEFKAIKEK